jgi:selenocysteine lyase/cysteine desulfurase
MTPVKSYKAHFQKFISADPKRIHFAAHSHHFWPDVTFDAHMKAWTDAATLADDKWDRFFGKLWPRAQRHVARILRLPDPSTIAFAPNTHELVMRVLSNLPAKMRVLTTDGEFHSFARQLSRLEEEGRAIVTRVKTEPLPTFADRFREARGEFDLVYVSHVFFDSSYALRDLQSVVAKHGVMIVDGYHAFCAIDVDLSKIADRIFYVGGGYKYAMSGEGCCFLHAPQGMFPRPIDTGWFAAFFAMQQKQEGVLYAEDASRFLGATFDTTALYRFDAAMSLLEREGITTKEIDERAKTLQAMFVDELRKHGDLPLRERDLVVPIAETNRGQFLVFRTPDAKKIHDALAARGVMTDVRGDRLRFGFAIYHDEIDVVEGARRIAEALV